MASFFVRYVAPTSQEVKLQANWFAYLSFVKELVKVYQTTERKPKSVPASFLVAVFRDHFYQPLGHDGTGFDMNLSAIQNQGHGIRVLLKIDNL